MSKGRLLLGFVFLLFGEMSDARESVPFLVPSHWKLVNESKTPKSLGQTYQIRDKATAIFIYRPQEDAKQIDLAKAKILTDRPIWEAFRTPAGVPCHHRTHNSVFSVVCFKTSKQFMMSSMAYKNSTKISRNELETFRAELMASLK